MTLQELTIERERLNELFADDPDNLELAMELLESEEALEDKADGYAAMMDRLGAEKAAHDGRKKYYYDKQKACKSASDSCERQINYMNERLLWMMKETGKTEFVTDKHKYKVGGVGGKRAVEYSDDDANSVFLDIALADQEVNGAYIALRSALIDKFGFSPFIPVFKFNTDDIRQHLEDGEELPFAKLADKKEKVRIK